VRHAAPNRPARIALASTALSLLAVVAVTAAVAQSPRRLERSPANTAAGAPSPDEPAGTPAQYTPPQDQGFPLAKLRSKLTTRFRRDMTSGPAPTPPPRLFRLERYPAPLGTNAAYVTPPTGGEPKPAMVWIHGGFDWSIGSSAWALSPRENNQSASAFRAPGMVLMLPSLRGTNDNPGQSECFLGEVDDIIAAGEYLRGRPDVDPERIYLGGHSTGGTLALLTAASTARFRAVFAFGAGADPGYYGEDGCLPESTRGPERRARAPIHFLSQIRTPTFVIEGADVAWVADYRDMRRTRRSAPVEFLIVPDADHFTVLGPGSEVVARAIRETSTASPGVQITTEMITQRMHL